MIRNNSGKALTIFLVLIAIILVSLTAISVFLLIKQVQLREGAESNLAQLKVSNGELQTQFDKNKEEKELLEKKTQEAELKIENLLEELDLAQGVRDEVKKKNRELTDSLDALKQKSSDLEAQLKKKDQEAEQRVNELQEQLDVALERNKNLEEKRQELEKEYQVLKDQLASYNTDGNVMEGSVKAGGADVELPKIVVSADSVNQGRIVSIDQEADFVIVNMGERQGVTVDTQLSIYNGEKYLGDILVTKVLPEMAAADFISPLTSQDVAEGNFVRKKE